LAKHSGKTSLIDEMPLLEDSLKVEEEAIHAEAFKVVLRE
jgi:hypothetical protein